MSSTKHEPVYHAAHGCQAAALSLTATRLRGLFWACQVESQKNGGFLALVERDQHELEPLSRSVSMLVLCVLKGGRLIALVMQPHGKDDPDPHISKRTHGDRMTFAFSSFALIILPGPCFTACRLPGKLVQGIAQRFNTRHPAMRFGVHPTLRTVRARFLPALADCWHPGSVCDHRRFRKASAGPGVCLLAVSSQRAHGPHASKKGCESPYHTEQCARSAAATDSPAPASSALWRAW